MSGTERNPTIPPPPSISSSKMSSTAASSSESELEKLKITSHTNDFDNFHHQNETDVSIYARSERSLAPSEILSSSEMSDGTTILLIRVLRHLSNLNVELGVLIPKIIELLEKAIQMENLAEGSSQYLLTVDSNLKLLRTSKDTLSFISIESIDPLRVNAVLKAINYLTNILLEAPQNVQQATTSTFFLHPASVKRQYETTSEAESVKKSEKPRRKKNNNALKPVPSTAVSIIAKESEKLAISSPPVESELPLKTADKVIILPTPPSTSKDLIQPDFSLLVTAICSSFDEAQKLSKNLKETAQNPEEIEEISTENLSTENLSTKNDFNISLGFPKALADVTLKITANESTALVSSITPDGTKTTKINEFGEVVKSVANIVIPVVTLVPQVVESVERAYQDFPTSFVGMMEKVFDILK